MRWLALFLAAFLAATFAQADSNRLKLRRFNNLYWVQQYGPAVDLDFTYLNPGGSYGRCYVKGTGLLPITSCLSDSRSGTTYGPKSDGTWSQFTAGNVPITDLGMFTAGGTTNALLWSDDLTNAVWATAAAGTLPTVVKDQTSPDGRANAFSSVLANSANSTVCQSATGSSTLRVFEFFLKQTTGSGEIDLSEDCSTWTVANSSVCVDPTTGAGAALSSSAWRVCTISATVANPNAGLRIVTSGDKVVAGWGYRVSVGAARYLLPCPTTTVAAFCGTDVITLTGAALAAVSTTPPYTLFGKTPAFNNLIAAAKVLVSVDDGTNNNSCVIDFATTAKGAVQSRIANVVTGNISTGNAATSGTSATVGGVCNSADYATSLSNGTVVTGSTAGTIGPFSAVHFGMFASNSSPLELMPMSRATIWNVRLTNAQMQGFK
jgi:hypothetical protein